jgi:hypothetical protein
MTQNVKNSALDKRLLYLRTDYGFIIFSVSLASLMKAHSRASLVFQYEYRAKGNLSIKILTLQPVSQAQINPLWNKVNC